MNDSIVSSLTALGIVLSPGLLALAGSGAVAPDTNEAIEIRRMCASKDDAVVHESFKGKHDTIARLGKFADVNVIRTRDGWHEVALVQDDVVVRGWVAGRNLRDCDNTLQDEGADAAFRTPRASFHPFGRPIDSLNRVDRVQLYQAFDCGYDQETRSCAWVGYCYAGPAVQRLKRAPASAFKPDPNLEGLLRADRADYKGSYKKDMTGFDRGHLVPDAAMKAFGLSAQRESYFLSNMTPQYSQLNQGLWRELEDAIRRWGTEQEVCVTTGPIYDEPVQRLKGSEGVAIPAAYFAIVTRGTDDEVEAIAIRAANEPVRRRWSEEGPRLTVSIDDLEVQTGFDFLSKLSDGREDPLEEVIGNLWE